MIIGISGYIGSGKDTVGQMLKELLNSDGHKFTHYSFAGPIKRFCGNVFGFDSDSYETNRTGKERVTDFYMSEHLFVKETAKILKRADIEHRSYNQVVVGVQLYHKAIKAISEHPDCDVKMNFFEKVEFKLMGQTNGYGYRIKASPRILYQLIGTEVFRDLDNDIWLKVTPKDRDIYVTDLRFENEEKYIKENDGVVIKVSSPNDPDPSTVKHSSEAYIKDINADIEIFNKKDGMQKLAIKVDRVYNNEIKPLLHKQKQGE